MPPISLILILLTAVTTTATTTSNSIEAVLDLKTRINRLVVRAASSTRDNSPTSLYVASTNHLYKITDGAATDSLKIELDLTTGPKLQRQFCAGINPSTAAQCIKYVCDEEAKSSVARPVDNENRLLLIDEPSQHLIECGSVDYGGCRLRQLTDLATIGCNYSAPVIPFQSASGVVVTSTSQLSSYASSSSG
jgi:hypothetical protein